jgi:acyl-CoA synthetase (NDP forming)
MEEFFDLAKAFELLEGPKGNRMAIMNLSGGEGVMATDACEMCGLELAPLEEKTVKELEKILPPWEISLNPFDFGVCFEFHVSDIPAFFHSLGAICEDGNVDAVVMQIPPALSHDSAKSKMAEKIDASLKQQVAQLILKSKTAGKPFALWRTTMSPKEKEWVAELESHSLPVFQSSVRAVKALSVMAEYERRRSEIDGP